MGVNVSVRHLQAGCLAPDVAAALAESGLPPRKLVLEITESVMLDAEDRLEGDLATLHGMGCVLSVDDFGRGYSSLAYLARLPVDILKLDREFVADIERDERGAALVSAVIDLGRRLGMDVVAEGVETAGQMRMLQDMSCALPPGLALRPPRGPRGAGRGARGLRPERARRRPGGRNGHASPYSGTGRLTSPAGEAHSVQVPRACLLVTGCPAAS